MKSKIPFLLFLSIFLLHCKKEQQKSVKKNISKIIIDSTKIIKTSTPKIEVLKIKKQNIEIPFYGKIELLESNKDSVNVFYGGDCGGVITRYKIDKKFITIDTTSCGDHGDTYTKYILDSLNSIEVIYKEDVSFISDGKIIKKLLIDFNEDPAIEKNKIDTVYSQKPNNQNKFVNDTIKDVNALYKYWNKNYKSVWEYDKVDP